MTDDHAVMSHIMNTLPSLSQLKNLAILLPHSFVDPKASSMNGSDGYSMDSKSFSKLTHLSMKIPQEWTQTSLLERLNLSNLQSLQLSLYLNSPERCQRAALNLSKIKYIKALKLSIAYIDQLQDILKLFFESIAGMELLTSFRINLTPSSLFTAREQIPSDVLTILEKILQKPMKIQDLSLECKELILSHEFRRLIEIFGASASSFKRLKLDAAPLVLEQENIGPFIRFVEGLEHIRTLKLPCVEIDSNQILTRLTSALVNLKEIRSISLEKIGGEKVGELVYLQSIERILEKRGLQIFDCDMTDDLRKRLESVGAPLSLEKITKKNPFLKSVKLIILMIIH